MAMVTKETNSYLKIYLPLVEALEKKPIDFRWLLQRMYFDEGDELHREVLDVMAAVPTEVVEEVATNPHIRLRLSLENTTLEFEVLAYLIGEEIYRRRVGALRSDERRPLPYTHPALADVEVDEDMLVNLSDLEVTDCREILRNGVAFSPTPPLRAVNSQYWSTQTLLSLSRDPNVSVSVRLDPLMVVPRAESMSMMYKMWVYGRDLDWDRICDLSEPESARWMPDDLSFQNVLFTDITWIPRGGEIHFECEEVPTDLSRPSRYFHAVLHRENHVFTHADAALRFFDDAQLNARKASKLENLGKIGQRVKLFRVDGRIDTAECSTLIAGAFVWNNDIERYFRAERPFNVENSPVLRDRRN